MNYQQSCVVPFADLISLLLLIWYGISFPCLSVHFGMFECVCTMFRVQVSWTLRVCRLPISRMVYMTRK